MKILLNAAAAFHYRNTGIGTYAAELLRALIALDSGHNLTVYTGSSLLPAEEALTADTTTDRDFWQKLAADQRVLPACDLCHDLQNGLGARPAGAPFVMTLHDMIPTVMPAYCGEPYRSLFDRFAVANAENADAVIAVSHRGKEDLLRSAGISTDRVHVIYEAPKSHCRPLPSELTREHLFRRYGLRPPFFLYVGGFNERKNVAALLRAYADSYRSFPFCCPLVIVGGDDPRRRRLVALAKDLCIDAYTRFVGAVPEAELPCFYNGATALFYPSRYEGFGLPPLEAAACGTVAVVCEVASLPEIMGDAALYVSDGDTAAIGRHMRRLLADPPLRKTMAHKALQRAAAFSFHRTAAETLAVYENICRRRSDPGTGGI